MHIQDFISFLQEDMFFILTWIYSHEQFYHLSVYSHAYNVVHVILKEIPWYIDRIEIPPLQRIHNT